jgi:uncharacterized protein (DUF1684 family)
MHSEAPSACGEEKKGDSLKRKAPSAFLSMFSSIAPVLSLVLLALGGCASEHERADPVYVSEIASWRETRIENLKKPTGWLTLVGLHWLSQGENAFGADSTNAVVFPRGRAPGFMGTISVEGDTVTVTVAPGVEVFHNEMPVTAMVLHHDQEEGWGPTVLTSGTLSWYVIERGGRLGVRVRDSDSRTLREFSGIESFPVDRRWRIEGRLEPHDPPRTVEITNALGDVSREQSPGSLVFEVNGETYRLDPIAEPDDEELFVVFGDATSGKETYGGGRFLDVARPEADGKVVLDFNKAYNPPCVFTPYATCPLPPPQNILPFAVRAGEKTYGKPGH